jgi:hypothetical protein
MPVSKRISTAGFVNDGKLSRNTKRNVFEDDEDTVAPTISSPTISLRDACKEERNKDA